MADLRKLNPALINKALLILRGLYLGYVYPQEIFERNTTQFPIGRLLLDPGLAKKISDEIGEFDLKGLQQAIERAATDANKVGEVGNKIIEIQNITADWAERALKNAETQDLGVPGVGKFIQKPILRTVRAGIFKLPKIPLPFTGKWIDEVSQLAYIKSIAAGQEKEAETEEGKQLGYSIPKDASAFETAQVAMKVLGESLLIQNVLKTQFRQAPSSIEAVFRHPQYKSGIVALDRAVQSDSAKLAKDPVFKKYMKDFPIVFDSIVQLATGLRGLPIIPIRELLTATWAATDDDRMKDLAYKMATMQITPEEAVPKILKFADENLTKSIMSGEFKKRRIPFDLATTLVFTSPMFWETLGIPLPEHNLISETLKGIAGGARSLAQKYEGTLLAKSINFFRDKKNVRREQFTKELDQWIDDTIGTKDGKQMADGVKASIKEELGSLKFDLENRTKVAQRFYGEMQDAVRSRMVGLTPAQQSAAIVRSQDPSLIAKVTDPEILKVFNDDIVLDAAQWIKGSLKNILDVDRTPLRSAYFPAWRPTFDSQEEFVRIFSAEPWKKSRDLDFVIPSIDNVKENITDLGARLAGPKINAILTKDAEDAATMTSIAMSKLRTFIDVPELNDSLGKILRDLPSDKRSPLSREIAEFMNFMFLTKRAPAWMSIEFGDDMIRTGINIYDNFKAGKFLTHADLRLASKIKPPAELFSDNFATQFIFNQDLKGIQKLAFHKYWNRFVMGISKNLANFRLRINFQNNLAQEINRARRLKGLAPMTEITVREEVLDNVVKPFRVSIDPKTGAYAPQISKPAIDATTKAIKVQIPATDLMTKAELQTAVTSAAERSREYQLAKYLNSSFTTNALTTLGATYTGFFLRLTDWSIKELGKSPEIFKAGGAALNLLRETNADATDFNKESVSFFGRMTWPFRKISTYGLIRVAADSLFGPVKDREFKLREELKQTKELAQVSPAEAFQILEKRPDLVDLHVQSLGRAMSSFIERNSEFQLMPRSLAADVASKMWGDMKERVPHWLPWGREMDQFLVAYDWPMPFRKFNEAAAVWSEETFNKDMAYEFSKMVFDGRLATEFDGDSTKAQESARDITQVKWLSNILSRNAIGLGAEYDEKKIDMYNKFQEFFNLPRMIVMPEKTRQKISEQTGIVDDGILDLIWRVGYDSALNFKQKLTNKQIDYMENYPMFRDFKNNLDVTRESKKARGAADEIQDNMKLLNRVPQDSHRGVLTTDRVGRAFLDFYRKDQIIGPDGNVLFNSEVASGRGKAILEFAQMTAEEQADFVNSKNEGVDVIRDVFPDKYQQLKSSRQNGFVISAPQTFEHDDVSNILAPFFKAIGKIDFTNPLGFPQRLSDILIENNPKKVKKFIDIMNAVKEETKKRVQILNEQLSDGVAYAALPPSLRPLSEKLEKGDDPFVNQAKKEADALVKEMRQALRTPGVKGRNDAMNIMNTRLPELSILAQDVFKLQNDSMHRNWSSPKYKPQNRQTQDMGNMLVGMTIMEKAAEWFDRGRILFRQPTSTPDTFKRYLEEGKNVKVRGKSVIDVMQIKYPARLELLKKKGEGFRYMFGFETFSQFDFKQPGQEAMFNQYMDIHYARPGEGRPEYEKRAIETITKMTEPQFQDMDSYFKDVNRLDVSEVYQKARLGLNPTIPLDKTSKLRIDAFRDRLPYIENDKELLKQALAQNPDLTEMIRNHEPRLFKTLEGKLFADLDANGLAYVKASGFGAKAMEYYRSLSPTSWARNFYKNDEFKSWALNNGFEPPIPGAETSGTRAWRDVDGTLHTERVPSVLANPEPLMPLPIPSGTFSSVPAMLNFANSTARREAHRLNIARENGAELNESQRLYLGSGIAGQTFQMLPSVIGQAWREGQLGPDQVIKSLDSVNKVAQLTGAVTPDQFNRFNQFLTTTTNTLGVARFGAQMGNFLDNTFNIPRLPVASKVGDFLLFGKPTSTLPVNDLGQEFSGVVAPTTNAGSAFILEGIPLGVQPHVPTPGPIQGIAPGVEAGGTIPAGTGEAAGATAAARGFPIAAVTIALIATAFTVSQTIKAKKKGKAARREAIRQQEMQEAEVLRLRARAKSVKTSAEQRQAAKVRLRRFEKERIANEQDFNRRLGLVLKEDATFASIAQQPKEFVNRFIDTFEPEVIEFTRRPTFASQIGLVSQIQSKLPKVRF